MVNLKRVGRANWRGTSDDPQELAEANAAFTGGRPNPENFPKDKGQFYFEADIPAFSNFPWDEVQLDKFEKTVKRQPVQ